MRIVILAALFACACAAPRAVFPRLPLKLMLSGRIPPYEMSERIVGGVEVVPNSIPFQIVLQRCGPTGCSLSCGGSILKPDVILNAAHCLQGVTADRLQVVAGDHKLVGDDGTEQEKKVSSFKNHADYNGNTFENDIALIFLESPLEMNENVATVNLPSTDLQNTNVPNGTLVTISGWGTTSSGGSLSNVLRKVETTVVDDALCDERYGATVIYESMICAGDLIDGGEDSCQGDSGGPLFTGEGANAIQWGIVSWGFSCATARFPGVYTETTWFLDWIQANGGA